MGLGHGKIEYPAELRERAVRMVAEVRASYGSEWAAIEAVATTLGIGTAETLRSWVRQAEVDAGVRVGVSSEEHAEIKRLQRELAELRRANEILKAASVFFASMSDDRPRWGSLVSLLPWSVAGGLSGDVRPRRVRAKRASVCQAASCKRRC
jgi:transposase